MAMDHGPSAATGFDRFVEKVTKLQVLAVSVIALVVPVLLLFKLDDAAAQGAAVLVAAAIIAASFYVWRLSEAKRVAAELRRQQETEWSARPVQSGFRGLYSYTRRDELPGRARRQLAKLIATQVAHPTFRYGVVSGEVGAGKSSLLDSGVARELEAGGYPVVFLRGLQEFSGGRSFATVSAGIRRRLDASEGEPVLILDQFEEMLIEWRTPEARRGLGALLRQPLRDRVVRVVCGVRADYLIALHDLSPELADPTSARTLFPVKNLDEQEAAEIILECAGRDGVAIQPAFAGTLASDLSQLGRVRPPELQLVCLALESSAPERSYRERGGAEGILSAHVRDACEGAAFPDLARRTLRALCNFQAVPPVKTQAKDVASLAAELGMVEMAADQLQKLEAGMGTLAGAGLVKVVRLTDSFSYALVHDYLVQPVALATSEVSTEAERATQLLRLHLSEYAADERSRIPLRRLRFIRRHADRELSAGTSARNLLRKSYRAGALRVAAIAAISMIGVVVVFGMQRVQVQWRDLGTVAKTKGRYGFEELIVSADRRHLFTQNVTDEDRFLERWDPRTGARKWRVPSADVTFSADRTAAIYVEPQISGGQPRPQRAFAVSTEVDAPIPTHMVVDNAQIFIDPAGRYAGTLSYEEPRQYRTVGLSDRRYDRHVALPRGLEIDDLAPHGDAALATRDGRHVIVELRSGSALDAPLPSFPAEASVVFDPSGTFVVGTRLIPRVGSAAILELISMDRRTREVVTARIPLLGIQDASIQFLEGGESLLVVAHLEAENFMLVDLVRTRDLHRAGVDRFRMSQLMALGNSAAYLDEDVTPRFAAWRSNRRTIVYDARSRRARPAAGLELGAIASSVVARHVPRLAITRLDGRVELWDTDRLVRITTTAPRDGNLDVRFTEDGVGLGIVGPTGGYELLDARTGARINIFPSLTGVAATFYDEACGRVHFWMSEGMVLRYVRGRDWPLFGFRPIRNCT